MVFESKKDKGIAWSFIGALIGIILGKKLLGSNGIVAVLVIWVFLSAFMLSNMYTIQYIITDSELIIKTGLIMAIKRYKETKNTNVQ